LYRSTTNNLAYPIYAILLAMFLPAVAKAQEPGPALDSGDTAWILVATGLVLFMTIPALALFYGGLVRTKNVLSILMQCLVLTALLSIVWVAFGYSLAFDSTGMVKGEIGVPAFIGGFSKCMLNGITPETVSGSIPEVLFAAFQMTFAVITPALMAGAFAERMKFSAVLVFSTVWLVVVYLPICHMTWAGEGGWFADMGVLDFAGGIVVHVTAGFAALVACIMVGKRRSYPEQMTPPHNLTMTVTGTAMLWVGWFGFNAGSALAANGSAAMTLLVTHLSACAATLVWMGIEWVKLGKPGVLGAATGSIAGLAAITPASGFVGPVGALVIGAASGAICFFFSTAVKKKFGYDDSLDVFGVHGIGGLVGTLLVAVFGATQMGGYGGFTDIGGQFVAQLTAAAVTAVYAMAASFAILLAIKATIGLRVSEEAEIEGLDKAEHAERGYTL
jgi:Amt family ammonium transporter